MSILGFLRKKKEKNIFDRAMNETAERHHQLGMMLGRQKRFREAIVAFTEALRHEPDNIQILFTRATAFYAEKQYDESIADYTTILEMEPRHVKALVGRAFAQAGKATSLVDRFKQEGGIHYSLTFEEACMPFDKLLRSLSPEKAAYFQMKRTVDNLTVEVRQDVESALRLDPANQGAQELLRFIQRDV